MRIMNHHVKGWNTWLMLVLLEIEEDTISMSILICFWHLRWCISFSCTHNWQLRTTFTIWRWMMIQEVMFALMVKLPNVSTPIISWVYFFGGCPEIQMEDLRLRRCTILKNSKRRKFGIKFLKCIYQALSTVCALKRLFYTHCICILLHKNIALDSLMHFQGEKRKFLVWMMNFSTVLCIPSPWRWTPRRGFVFRSQYLFLL